MLNVASDNTETQENNWYFTRKDMVPLSKMAR